MRWMLDCPADVCVPELLLEHHRSLRVLRRRGVSKL